MKLTSFDIIVQALNGAGVRYLVVGGLAVNAHGYIRATTDVDLVIQLSAPNIRAALEALAEVGYHPAQPVTAAEFSDPTVREAWRHEKQMLVLKLWSDAYRETPVDVFVFEPFDFDREYECALQDTTMGASSARFVAIPALIAMKEAAGRDRDLIDIEKLRQIANFKNNVSENL
ncbi:MAG: hypothetical protein WEB60_04920 [Terrimicrobiaceae bacterium]